MVSRGKKKDGKTKVSTGLRTSITIKLKDTAQRRVGQKSLAEIKKKKEKT